MAPSSPERRSTRNPALSPRAPQATRERRCRQCPPPHPLQRECVIHSRRARTRAAKLKPQSPSVSIDGGTPRSSGNPEPPSEPRQDTTTPPPNVQLPTSSTSVEGGSLPIAATTAASELDQSTPDSSDEPEALASSMLLQPNVSPPPVAAPQSLEGAQQPQSGGQFRDFPNSALLTQNDPFGLTIDSPPLMDSLIDDAGHLGSDLEVGGSYLPITSGGSVSSPPVVAHPGSTLPGSSPSSSSVSSSPLPSTPSTPSPSTRVRYARTYLHGQRQHPTRAKPTFGSMIAKKGSSRYEVVWTGSLVGRVDRKDMNRRFTRGLDRILLNCERLADETGCWLYLATNHPSVHGEYVHWMSPSMHQDLPSDTRVRFDDTAGGFLPL
ncbi:hypothetical protein PM082_002425 [Marasmius tenuissimus]|nr:hypothetical protein PM082_002425 [Marasmius tenuissimus]